jgi:glycosyltransferase involved in cell wall biosynthesis
MSRLVVGMDARALARQPTGVGRYVRNLARALSELEDAPELRLYLPQQGAAAGAAGAREEVLRTPAALRSLDNMFTWTHARLPLHLARHPVDLLHGTFYTLPALCPCPAVVTIHDITFDLHPEWFTPRARLAFSGFAAASARKARHVLTVSECSRRDILARYGLAADRVTAIPLAPDPDLARVEDPGRLAAARRTHDLPERYLLHVGAITPRRNIPRLLEAFARVRSRETDLVLALAGPVEEPAEPLDPLLSRLGIEPWVRRLGYVPPADLPALYSGALAVVYPSLYEGFGLPVVEAMACGVPVLAADGSCFPEVAGDAALLVDPEDIDALAAGLRALVEDAGLRERLVRAGLERVTRYTWEATARATLAVYRQAVRGHA